MIYNSLNNFRFLKKGLKEFPVEFSYFPPLKKRLKIAVEIDKAEHSVKKKNDSIGWLKKNAAAMEIDLDDDLLDEGENSQVVKTNQRFEFSFSFFFKMIVK